jgi:hypothetical protein
LYLYKKFDVPDVDVVIESNLFPEVSQKNISMIFEIFGKAMTQQLMSLCQELWFPFSQLQPNPSLDLIMPNSWQIKFIIISHNLNLLDALDINLTWFTFPRSLKISILCI